MHPLGFLSVALSLTSVNAHGYLKSVEVKGVSYLGFQINADKYVKPTPDRYIRRVENNGPVPDFTTTNITCGTGLNQPAVLSVPVNPGDKILLKWDQWGSSHSGPVMNYLADCGGSCQTFKGETGTPWVKFEQMAYDLTKSPPWGSDFLAKQGASWTVTLPDIKPGEYLLRHEILGLHVAGKRLGAQFYPFCVHLKVGGGGTKGLPSGIALPGAYDPDDTNGVLVQLWKVNAGQVNYTAPGGPVKII
ncbi:glycoside hydrolase [Paraphoma chrysanthemicola]|uniref:lytic cellulose monooxygenase (C4-dehydrogenating) n=1 Tax=Paraphoma chrysanthemicola TaxID=798071 RepID=A0A8K0VWP1_9PLEO|nr:glycoside hydrolase [Paraphoma chrysanthemicola]